jgi:hypothetical protein
MTFYALNLNLRLFREKSLILKLTRVDFKIFLLLK